MRTSTLLLGLAALGAAGTTAVSAQRPAAETRLVVFIAVDQLRGDYFQRFAPDFAGGLKRLYDQGAFYGHGEQDHAITETAPGHSTMLSGRSPASTGIVTNEFGVTDPSSPLIAGVGPGASPHRFQGTTLYDWMLAKDPATRVVSVSMKDRGAILPVGRARAPVFWYSRGLFTTSAYYARELPAWVQAFNAQGAPYAYMGKSWNLLLPATAYAEPDSQPWERGGNDVTFPHPIVGDSARVVLQFPSLPWMDSLTMAFALEGVKQEGLGMRDGPDLLSISLSATDVIGHAYGPDSREIHDHLVRLDRWLGVFLDSLATLVPRDRIVVALTADHGVTPYPEANQARGRPGGRVSLTAIAQEAGQEFFARYRTDFGFEHNNGILLVDVDALRARGVNVDSLADALAQKAAALPGVKKVFTPKTLARATDLEGKRWQRSIPPTTGWLVAASPEPGYIWILSQGVAMHGTTNMDDVQVPIVFMGQGIPSGKYSKTVRTVDIAPTLAAYIGIKPTEPVEGVVLPEVVKKP